MAPIYVFRRGRIRGDLVIMKFEKVVLQVPEEGVASGDISHRCSISSNSLFSRGSSEAAAFARHSAARFSHILMCSLIVLTIGPLPYGLNITKEQIADQHVRRRHCGRWGGGAQRGARARALPAKRTAI